MDVSYIIESLPDDIKEDIADLHDVLLKDNRHAIRIVIDRVLTEKEKNELKKNKKIIGTDLVANMKSAPEIRRSYFYFVVE